MLLWRPRRKEPRRDRVSSGEIEAGGEIPSETRSAQLWALTPRGKAKTRGLREWDEIDAEQQKGQAA